jgi:hypothetical protein
MPAATPVWTSTACSNLTDPRQRNEQLVDYGGAIDVTITFGVTGGCVKPEKEIAAIHRVPSERSPPIDRDPQVT